MNVLECKNLKKAYKKGNFVLNNFNICIPEGKIIGLLGPNGCGNGSQARLTWRDCKANSNKTKKLGILYRWS